MFQQIIIKLLLLFTFPLRASAQTSFQISRTFPVPFGITDVQVTENAEFSSLCWLLGANTAHMSVFDATGLLKSNYAVHSGLENSSIFIPTNYVTNGTNYAFSFHTFDITNEDYSQVVGFDADTGIAWSKDADPISAEGTLAYVGLIGENTIFDRTWTTNFIDTVPVFFALSLVNTQGNSIWDYRYGLNSYDYVIPKSFTTTNNGHTLVLCHSGESANTTTIIQNMIIEIDENGIPIRSVKMPNFWGQNISNDG